MFVKNLIWTQAFFVTFFVFSAPVPAHTTGIKSIQEYKNFRAAHPEVRHIEDILPHFDPSVFAKHEYVYESESQHGSSVENPRVIYFTKDGRFAIALNGDPSQDRYNVLEMYEFFDLPDGKFTKHADTFAGDTERMIAYRTARGLDTKLKPMQACATCHRKDFRTNWDTYSLNPGVFEGEFSGVSDKVVSAVKEFYKSASQHKRYKYAKEETRGGFANAVNQLNQVRILRKILENENHAFFRFALIGAVGGCENIEEFLPFKAAESGLRNYKEMLADTTERVHADNQRKIDRMESEIERGLRKRGTTTYVAGNATVERETVLSKEHLSENSSIPGVAALRFLAQFMNLDMSAWSMVKNEGTYSFRQASNPFTAAYGYYTLEPDDKMPHYNKYAPVPIYNGEDDFLLQLVRAFKAEKETFHSSIPKPFDSLKPPYIPPHESKDFLGYVNCDSLKEASLKALERWTPPAPGTLTVEDAEIHTILKSGSKPSRP